MTLTPTEYALFEDENDKATQNARITRAIAILHDVWEQHPKTSLPVLVRAMYDAAVKSGVRDSGLRNISDAELFNATEALENVPENATHIGTKDEGPIHGLLTSIERAWRQCPDQRFGQFMINLESMVKDVKGGVDIPATEIEDWSLARQASRFADARGRGEVYRVS